MFFHPTMHILLNVLIVVLTPKLKLCHQVLCYHEVFCQGELLDMVQSAGIFKDSKTFVDMSMSYSIPVILKNFQDLKDKTGGHPTKQQIMNFVNANFQSSYNELEIWKPEDFKTNPLFLKKIRDLRVQEFSRNLVTTWLNLGRKVRNEVWDNPLRFSLIPVPNGFIIPGGRFREFYYWDSLWIVKGLLICEMARSAKGMIENFFHIVKTYGFIPNGGRIYYLDRSQPPLLTLMVSEYMRTTNDITWLQKNIKFLDMELQFWLDRKTVEIFKDGNLHVLARYISFSDDPRPESYIEDLHTARHHTNDNARKNCLRGLRTAAESGWDFSGRWIFDNDGGNHANLTHIDTPRVIPVDLNAFLCKSFKILHQFYAKFNNKERSRYWLRRAKQFEEGIAHVLHNPNDGTWYDFDIKLARPRKYFYPSNLAPLWMECYDTNKKRMFGKNATAYLKRNKITTYEGGIPTSLSETGEQWDYPNAWAPLQAIIIFGLERTGEEEAMKLARNLANKWIQSNLIQYEDSKYMFEKYNAVYSGIYGSGGEYEVQTGFGWTNGVVLELIEYFYIKKPERRSEPSINL